MWCDQAKWVWNNKNLELHFAEWKSHEIWTHGSKDSATLVLLKTMKYKENWLLLSAKPRKKRNSALV